MLWGQSARNTYYRLAETLETAFWLALCCRIALVLGCLHLEKMEKPCKQMEFKNASLKEANLTIAEQREKLEKGQR